MLKDSPIRGSSRTCIQIVCALSRWDALPRKMVHSEPQVQFGTVWKGFLEELRRGWGPDPGFRGQMERHGKVGEKGPVGDDPAEGRKGPVSTVGRTWDS